jgi:hypothetical protein
MQRASYLKPNRLEDVIFLIQYNREWARLRETHRGSINHVAMPKVPVKCR